jgi:hypothetical protein
MLQTGEQKIEAANHLLTKSMFLGVWMNGWM